MDSIEDCPYPSVSRTDSGLLKAECLLLQAKAFMLNLRMKSWGIDIEAANADEALELLTLARSCLAVLPRKGQVMKPSGRNHWTVHIFPLLSRIDDTEKALQALKMGKEAKVVQETYTGSARELEMQWGKFAAGTLVMCCNRHLYPTSHFSVCPECGKSDKDKVEAIMVAMVDEKGKGKGEDVSSNSHMASPEDFMAAFFKTRK